MSKNQRQTRFVDEHTWKTFTKIADFVAQLHEAFCQNSKFHEIELYNHLLGKTKLSNKAAIHKHIELFSSFCLINFKAIETRNINELKQEKVSYSDKVFLDMKQLLTISDNDTSKSIWDHLLVISACTDPTSKATELLKELQNSNTSENQFLNKFLQKVESSIDPQKATSNPMEAAASLLQGGVLNDLISSMDTGIKSGDLDISKLMGTVQGMLGSLSNNSNNSSNPLGNIDMGSIMGMVGNMMGQMNNTNSSSSSTSPDPLGNLGSLMSNLGGLGAFTSNANGISGIDPEKALKQIEEKVEKERLQLIDQSTPIVSELPNSNTDK